MTRLPKIAFLVNGSPSSAMGHRAKTFACHLQSQFQIQLLHRQSDKLQSIRQFFRNLWIHKPDLCYVFDMAYSGVLAGAIYKTAKRCPLIIDTGDAIADLARAMGRGRLGCWMTSGLERFSFAITNGIVVRGSYHRELLERRGLKVEFIPDGVELNLFEPFDVFDLRHKLGIKDRFVVGLVGSVVWNARQESCYGAELVEILHLLRDLPLHGILIGDGSGIPILQERCRKYGIEDRIHFLGRLPYEELPPYLNLFDVALSTQTNDLPGRVRTTGKLPLYLACGRFVLASCVGEAAKILPSEMLVDYDGSYDPRYSQKLAERIRRLHNDRSLLNLQRGSRELAIEHFDYQKLSKRLANFIRQLV